VSVYVDNAMIPATVGRVRARWCHLTADTQEELRAFAASIGLNPAWWQTCKRKCGPEGKPCIHWHFDVTRERRADAVAAGAQEIDIRRMSEILAARRVQQRAQP